jgi:SPOR domain
MSALADPPAAGCRQPQIRCEQCGAPMADDQEWCLECGTARTLFHRPPDWRIAAAIVATVVVLALAGFAIALINLSSESNRSVSSAPAAVSATTPTASKSASATSSSIPGWPVGLPGWTVIVFSSTSQSAAQTTARRLDHAGLHVGVLSTSEHPSTNMNPGHYAVFVGRYATEEAAGARAKKLKAQGYRARARLVAVPGSR